MTAIAPPADPPGRLGLLVTFDGPRLLDRDGGLLAELHADGHWYDERGEPCDGLAFPTPTPVIGDRRGRSEQAVQADRLWLQEAAEAIASLACSQQYLTGDDVWAALRTPPRESKMIGNALSRAKQAGVIASTGEHRQSTRKQNHGRPILIWRSLTYGQQTLIAP